MTDLKLVYYGELTHITETTVTYTHPAHLATLTLPRKEWENMGRPGLLKFTPELDDRATSGKTDD